MIAVDTNVLVAFHRSEYPAHAVAVRRLKELAEGAVPWALPWPCVHEFLAVVTNGRIFRTPTPPAEAVRVIDVLMESPVVRLIGEGPAYWPRLRKLVESGPADGPRVHDARVAAICLDHGVSRLWTADRDFGRFPALRVENPLVG